MKRILFILVLMTLCVSFSTYFLAAEQDKTGMKTMIGKKMMSKTMDNERKQMMEMCPMHTKMMKNMMSKSIVETEDDGIVVMIGNKLFKYDKNLKLKNETEIEIDMEAMHKKMMEMKKKCPMPTKMMKNMMSKFIVATEDNGVVVMIGNKLFKYDKNLKLKNEAELKIDMEAMHKKMMEIKEKCPMCHKMMEKSDKTMLKDGNVVK